MDGIGESGSIDLAIVGLTLEGVRIGYGAWAITVPSICIISIGHFDIRKWCVVIVASIGRALHPIEKQSTWCRLRVIFNDRE